MKRTNFIAMTAAVLVVAMLGVSFAYGGGNARKGKFLYRKHCRACHGKTASDLSPSTYKQAEWTAKFSDVSTIPCHGEWNGKVEDGDINDIFSYLHDFAKDSPSPAKCS